MKTQNVALTAIAMAFSAAALGQNGAGAVLEEEELAVLPEFKTIDANEDGMIVAAETESLAKMLLEEHRVEFRFETVDENEDGRINNAEYIAYDRSLQEQLGIA